MRDLRPVSAPARVAAVCLGSLMAGLACSSSSSSSNGAMEGGASDDAATEGGGSPGSEASTESGAEDSQDASTAAPTCDAAIVLPTDGSTGTACGQCIAAHCVSELALCQPDCLCASSIQCLAVHDDNYTLCMGALAAIGAGNAGLTAVAGCIAMNCVSVCNPTD
ncbi:MAG: hypothetical protein ACRENE_03550 [Polyangiaceae bacterium]